MSTETRAAADTAQAAVTAAREADCAAQRSLHDAQVRAMSPGGIVRLRRARTRKQATWAEYRAALEALRDAEEEVAG